MKPNPVMTLLQQQLSRFNLSLTSKLLVAVLAAFIVLCSGNYFISYRMLEANLLKNVLTNINQSSQLINATVASATNVRDNNLHTLETYFNEMLKTNERNGIVYITVAGSNGRILMHAGNGKALLPAPDLPANYAQAAHAGIIHVRDQVLLENNEIGFLQYGIATQDLMQAMADSGRSSLILTSIVIFLSFIALALFGMKMTSRLSALKYASQEIAAGHYDLHIPEIGRDELNEVAHSFNLMSDAVQSKVKEISILNAELEQRVQHRTMDIDVANLQLERNQKELHAARETLQKSEKLASLGAIVAGITHEINTPIGNALMAAGVINELVTQFGERTAEGKVSLSELRQFIQQCQEGSQIVEVSLGRAAELIQSFKQVAVDQSSERRRIFNLASTITETITTLKHTFKNKPYTLGTNIPDTIIMDSYPGALGQIMTNFINNALLHAFEGKQQGHMQINAEMFAPNWVRISFTDDGNGIPVGHLKRIFEPFFTTRHGHGGSGLGLNVVDNIVHRILGGQIDVASQVGFGTIFKIELPLVAPVVAMKEGE